MVGSLASSDAFSRKTRFAEGLTDKHRIEIVSRKGTRKRARMQDNKKIHFNEERKDNFSLVVKATSNHKL